MPLLISCPCVVEGLYYIALSGLVIYGLHRLWLLFCVYRERRGQALIPEILPSCERNQRVTVQLPIYNERFVAARLLDSVVQFEWPSDRLEIQVLDDSTDDTKKIIDSRVEYWTKKGLSIKVFRRSNRKGFKAGALKEGLRHAKGDFIAIFDADFLPSPDFLTRTMSYFADPCVGMVQGRWGFLNTRHTWFTRIQALLLAPTF